MVTHTTHSPAPWRRDGYDIIDATGLVVTELGWHDGPASDNPFDWSLLTAAPELLAALKALVESETYKNRQGSAMVSNCVEVEAARAAIASAEGR